MSSLMYCAARLLTRAYPFWSGQGDLVQMPPLRWLQCSHDELVVRLRNGLRIVIFPNDHIGQRVYFFGDLDWKVTVILKSILQAGDTFVDVGANIGIVSAQCLPRVGASGRVVAVEPQVRCARALRETINLNGISNMEIYTLAISDRNGLGRMEIQEPGNLGTASLKPEGPREAPGIEGDSDVQIRDAGEFLESLNITGDYAIKIDVEGHEAAIIASAARYLERHPPKVLLFESWSTARESQLNDRFRDIQRRMSQIGLDVFKIPKRLCSVGIEQLADGKPDPSSSDYVALRPDVQARLRENHARWFRA